MSAVSRTLVHKQCILQTVCGLVGCQYKELHRCSVLFNFHALVRNWIQPSSDIEHDTAHDEFAVSQAEVSEITLRTLSMNTVTFHLLKYMA